MPEKPEPQPVDTSIETSPETATLPEAVMEYVRRHNKIVQDKILAAQPVTAKDLEFIDKVKIWIHLPAEQRDMYPSVEEMEKTYLIGISSAEIREAAKRQLTPSQWRQQRLELVGYRKYTEYRDDQGKIIKRSPIDTEYYNDPTITEFPDGLIIPGFLRINRCPALKALPRNLTVAGSLDAKECPNLETVGDNLRVGGHIDFMDSIKLRRLPDGLTVNHHLNVSGCVNLRQLPENLTVSSLTAYHCTGLDSLPQSLLVRDSITVTGCNRQVKNDAQRLGVKIIDDEGIHFGKSLRG